MSVGRFCSHSCTKTYKNLLTTRNADWHFVQTRVSTACLFYGIKKLARKLFSGYGSSVLLSSVILNCMILCGSSSNTMRCLFLYHLILCWSVNQTQHYLR